MKAEQDIRAAVLAALRGDAALMAKVNRVHDGAPAKATPPTCVLGECSGTDWGCKDRPGREVRIVLTIEDDMESTSRISAILPVADAAVQSLPGTVPGAETGTGEGAGWAIASLRPVRSRLLRTNAGRWNALLDYRIRVLAV